MKKAKKKKPTSVTLFCSPVCYDENGSDAVWAVVTLTTKYIATLISRIDLFSGLKHAISDLCHIEEFDYAVDHIKYGTTLDTVGDLAADEGWHEISEKRLPKDTDLTVSVECCVLIVDERDVYWEAYLKHTQIRIATAHFSREDLARIAESLDEC